MGWSSASGCPVGQARGCYPLERSRKRTTVTKSPTSPLSDSRLRLLPGIGLVDLSHPELAGRLADIAAAQLEAFGATMRQGLLAASVAVGLGVFGEFLAAEVTEKAGPKGRHDPHRAAYRHGTEPATVPLGGDLRGEGVEGDGHPDHCLGDRDDGGVAEPAPRGGVPCSVRRRDLR